MYCLSHFCTTKWYSKVLLHPIVFNFLRPLGFLSCWPNGLELSDSSGIQRAVNTVIGVYSKRDPSRDTSGSSALGALNDSTLYINLHTHSLTWAKILHVRGAVPSQCALEVCRNSIVILILSHFHDFFPIPIISLSSHSRFSRHFIHISISISTDNRNSLHY